MKTSCLLLIFITALLKANGQSDSAISKPANIRLAYNSSIIYPGAAIGIDFPVQDILFTKHWNNGDSMSILRQRFISGSIGYYHHRGFHDNIYILPEWVMRRTPGKTWFTEFNFGLGYSRTFLGGTTYNVAENGVVSIIHAAGYSYAMAAAGFGVGYNLSYRNTPFALYTRFNLLIMFPYNSTVYPRPTLEIGMIYDPPHFMERKLRHIHKIKHV